MGNCLRRKRSSEDFRQKNSFEDQFSALNEENTTITEIKRTPPGNRKQKLSEKMKMAWEKNPNHANK